MNSDPANFGDPILPERFWSKVRRDASGCWLWTGAKTRSGYGQSYRDGKYVYAYAWLHEAFFGPVPEGLYLRRTCDVKACVSPHHIVRSTWHPREKWHDMTLEQVFQAEMRRATKTESGCMISSAARRGGREWYPQIGYRGRLIGLHRLAVEIKIGRSLRTGEMARHRCHDPRCINPDHLDPGTALQNADDARRAGRLKVPKGTKHPQAKLDVDKVRRARETYRTGGNLSALAREFGVDPSAMHQAATGKTWKHVT